MINRGVTKTSQYFFNSKTGMLEKIDDNEELAKAAVAAGVWFDTFDFTPAENDKVNIILSTLKEGNRAKITDAISKYGKDEVVNVATYHVEELTTAVVSMLENLLKIQLVID